MSRTKFTAEETMRVCTGDDKESETEKPGPECGICRFPGRALSGLSDTEAKVCSVHFM